MRLSKAIHALCALAVIVALGGFARPPKALRLYVLDCGGLTATDPSMFGLSKSEVSTLDLANSCYLVVHRKGTLLFDTGINEAWLKTPMAVTFSARVNKPLAAQLSEIGVSPADIDYLVLSHMHADHTGNANDFAGATWLVQKAEHEAMFAPAAQSAAGTETYSALKASRTEILDGDRDVFGDGTVIIKATPGHTPGSQSLFVKLANTGPVLLSGDLWHFPEQRALDRVPTFEFNKDQTRASRAAMERFMKETGAELWIGHDARGFAARKKAPAFYD